MSALIAAAVVGLQVGDFVSPFEPYHVTGPYADTNQCPVCEWGLLPLVFVWTRDETGSAELKAVVKTVNQALSGAAFNAKGFLVDANLSGNNSASKRRLKKWSSDWKTESVYFLSRPANLDTALKDYKLGAAEKWTTVVYLVKDRKVTAALVDPVQSDLSSISSGIASLGGTGL